MTRNDVYALKIETGADDCECCGYFTYTERALFKGDTLMAQHYSDTHLAGGFHTDLEEAVWVLGNIKGVDIVEYATLHTNHSVDINEFAWSNTPPSIRCNLIIDGGKIIVDGELLCTYSQCKLDMEDDDWHGDEDEAAKAILEALSVKVA